MTPAEQGTTISFTRADEQIQFYSCDPVVVRRLRNHPLVTIIESGEWDGAPYVFATCPRELWTPLGGLRKRAQLSDAERKRRSEVARAAFGSARVRATPDKPVS